MTGVEAAWWRLSAAKMLTAWCVCHCAGLCGRCGCYFIFEAAVLVDSWCRSNFWVCGERGPHFMRFWWRRNRWVSYQVTDAVYCIRKNKIGDVLGGRYRKQRLYLLTTIDSRKLRVFYSCVHAPCCKLQITMRCSIPFTKSRTSSDTHQDTVCHVCIYMYVHEVQLSSTSTLKRYRLYRNTRGTLVAPVLRFQFFDIPGSTYWCGPFLGGCGVRFVYCIRCKSTSYCSSMGMPNRVRDKTRKAILIGGGLDTCGHGMPRKSL